MKKSFFILVLFINSIVYAQFTELINSNRPGFSESPYSVGTGVYQFESGFFYENTQPIPVFSRPKSSGIKFAFRTSFFFEKLEFNTHIQAQNDNTYFTNIFQSNTGSELGLSKLNLGAKYLVYEPTYKDKSKEVRSWKRRMVFDWKRLIPAVSVYAGVNFGVVLNSYYEKGGITPKVGVLLQQNITPYLNVITNFYYDNILSDYTEISYILTTTYSFTDRFSWFIEAEGVYGDYTNRNSFGGGFAYLYNRNLQLDISGRLVTNYQAKGGYFGIGASYRIDNHIDDFKQFDQEGNEIKEIITDYENKGFFSKMLDKIKGLFKKKNKKKVETDLPPDSSEKSKIKGRNRERKKSFIDDVKKLDAKEKRKLERKNKKEAKRKAREEKKRKKKEAKEKKKLEKEIKKLEQEIKEEEKKNQKKEDQ